jgi:hypothetical protein
MASGGTGNYYAEAARTVKAASLNTGEKITFSFYAKGEGSTIGKNVRAHIYGSGGGTTISTGTSGKLTNEWKRYSHTLTWTGGTASNASYSVYAVGESFTQDEVFYACNFQFEIGGEAHPYNFL